MESVVTILQMLAFGGMFGAGVVLLTQVLMLRVAVTTARRKGIKPVWCWLLLAPYLGMVVAYWIACAPEVTRDA